MIASPGGFGQLRGSTFVLLVALLPAAGLQGQDAPTDGEARARALYARDDLQAAGAAYLALADTNTSDVEAARFASRAAWIYHQDGTFGPRDEALRTALRRDPALRLDEASHDAAFLQRLEEVRIEIEAERSLALQNLIARAGSAQNAGRWEESSRLYAELLELEPDNVPARLRHALTLINAGQPGAADATLGILRDSMETLDPEVQREVRFLGAMARIRNGTLDGVEPVIQRMPADRQRQLWLALADQHQRNQAWEDAIETFGRVLEMTPDDRQTAIYRARLLGQLDRWPEAESFLFNLSETLPDSAAVWNELGRVRQQLGDVPGALGAFRRAASTEPADETDRLARVSALVGAAGLLRTEDPAAAAEYVSLAAAASPSDPDVLAMQSRLATSRGEHDRGVELANAARSAAPDRVDLRNLVGNAYYQAGRMREAISAFEDLLEDHPNLAAVRENLELAREAGARSAGATPSVSQPPPTATPPTAPSSNTAQQPAGAQPAATAGPASPRTNPAQAAASQTSTERSTSSPSRDASRGVEDRRQPSPDASELPIGIVAVPHRWERTGRNVLRVESVEEVGKGARCGIQSGDLLIRLDGQPLDDSDAMERKLEGATSGIRFDIVRDGKPMALVCV